MVDFLNHHDSLSYTDIRKKLLTLMEKITLYKHHIAFINTYICFNVIPREFQLKFHCNIPSLKKLRNCSKNLMFKIVSKFNSDIKRILNDVSYYKNYLHNFYFDESEELLDHINIKQLKVFRFLYRVRCSKLVRDGLPVEKPVEYAITLLGIFTRKKHVPGEVQ